MMCVSSVAMRGIIGFCSIVAHLFPLRLLARFKEAKEGGTGSRRNAKTHKDGACRDFHGVCGNDRLTRASRFARKQSYHIVHSLLCSCCVTCVTRDTRDSRVTLHVPQAAPGAARPGRLSPSEACNGFQAR